MTDSTLFLATFFVPVSNQLYQVFPVDRLKLRQTSWHFYASMSALLAW